MGLGGSAEACFQARIAELPPACTDAHGIHGTNFRVSGNEGGRWCLPVDFRVTSFRTIFQRSRQEYLITVTHLNRQKLTTHEPFDVGHSGFSVWPSSYFALRKVESVANSISFTRSTFALLTCLRFYRLLQVQRVHRAIHEQPVRKTCESRRVHRRQPSLVPRPDGDGPVEPRRSKSAHGKRGQHRCDRGVRMRRYNGG